MFVNRAAFRVFAASFALSLSGTALAAAATDIPPEPGETWKVTTSMSMMGMTMPGMTSQVCAPKNTDQAPVETSKECQILDRRRSGNKETMHMRCTGKQAMEGTLEIEYLGKDHYRGKMLAKMAEGEMTMNYEGQKLGTACDAAEMKRKMAQLQGQADAVTAKTCAEGAKAGAASYFLGATPICKDPKDKQAFCANAQTHKTFSELAQRERVSAQRGGPDAQVLARSAAFCGFKVDATRASLCGSSEGKGQWAFLAGECPSLADPLAKRECAGRGFTTPVAPKYKDFCSAYASSRSGNGFSGGDESTESAANSPGVRGNGAGSSAAGSQQGNDPSQQQQDQKPSTADKVQGVLKSVDKLRGIFGR